MCPREQQHGSRCRSDDNPVVRLVVDGCRPYLPLAHDLRCRGQTRHIVLVVIELTRGVRNATIEILEIELH